MTVLHRRTTLPRGCQKIRATARVHQERRGPDPARCHGNGAHGQGCGNHSPLVSEVLLKVHGQGSVQLDERQPERWKVRNQEVVKLDV